MTRLNEAHQHGFTLLEMVCVIALIALMATVSLPFLPQHTSRARLQAYAVETAALLKGDRNAAIGRHAAVAALVDSSSRTIRSGSTTQLLRIPDDVRFDALLPQTCHHRAALSTISFFADGMSCGGTIALARLNTVYEIRVNWLTGRIEIADRSTSRN